SSLQCRDQGINIGRFHEIFVDVIADTLDSSVNIGGSRQDNRNATWISLPHGTYDLVPVAWLANIQVRQQRVELVALYFRHYVRYTSVTPHASHCPAMSFLSD